MNKHQEKSIRIQKICDYIQKNIDRPVCLEDFSSYLGISSVTLVKFFKNQFNCTPIDYVWSIKTIVGGYLIYMNKTKTQQEIAESLGFKSNEHFSRRLKQIFELNGKSLRFEDSKHLLYAKSKMYYVDSLACYYKENINFYEFLNPKEKVAMDGFLMDLSYDRLIELVNAKARALGYDYVFCRRSRERLFLDRSPEKWSPLQNPMLKLER